ncbi:MAG: Eco57I restriction-modification methylase domain-containing protein, partial [Armatimonadota bacterium]
MPEEETLNPWWADLRHGGMIISPAVLDETFPSGASSVDGRPYQKLRDAWNRFEAWLSSAESDSGSAAPLHRWLDAVLEEYLGHPADRWLKGAHVGEQFKAETLAGERLRPNRVLMRDGEGEAALLLMVDRNKRIGIGRGRRTYANLLHLLRETGNKLGLLTNGVQFRLVYAGLDHDAWVEWDAEAWFAEGERRRQLGGLVTLLGQQGMQARDGLAFPLLDAVETSRDKQGELSQVMGEQVRRAIETVLSRVDRAARANPELLDGLRHDPETGEALDETEWLAALFQAATRLVMRLVVALFAEARDLLPKSLESYYHSYSVEGLFEQLTSAEANEGTATLEDRHYAWSRLMSLFRLIHEGSSHPDLPVPEYGGTLFRRGDGASPDPIVRALAIFESGDFEMSDLAVLRVLRLLKIGRVKARRGRQASWVSGPVDFSDLRTEYIGMIYEGLLDFQLRQVGEDEGAVVFLNIGQEPALPLSLLEGMDDADLNDLLGKLKAERAKGPDLSEDEEDEEELEELEELEEEAEEEEEEPGEEPEEDLTEREELRLQVHEWAVHAVKVAGLVSQPRGERPDRDAYEEECREEAVSLIRQIVAPGEMYLIRSGGTRKGTGTFYTRPQLAVPTTHRTLRPLAYDVEQEDEPPRTPAEILSLKVCAPAVGSGSFLVAALRYLTDALYESLHYHRRVREAEAGTVITLPFGEKDTGGPFPERLPVPPDDERFEHMLKARLKRHVVERCIYGVDINPMAVELARLSLWIETMDRELPFEFLDHKLKVGNSLVGCWLDRYQDYPARAWERDAGDSGADYRAVNFRKGEVSQRIKDTRNETVKDELRSWIEERGPQQVMRFGDERETGLEVQEDAREQFEHIHDMPRHLREDAYRRWQQSDEFEELRQAFDRWCAIWFWPMEDETAPRLTPARFHEDDPRLAEIAREVAREQRFFHWELEFPDVFTPDSRGFDAVLGNPPWEIMKPISKEFFSRYDPIYRARGKQEALDVQQALFERDPRIERRWLEYCASFRAMSNWVKHSEEPFDFPLRGKGQKAVKEQWERIRDRRSGVAHPEHPYRHQGSADLNTYKMFLEVSHHLLRDGGRLGMLAPSGIYTDKGTQDLRRLFLEESAWEWLFGFENRKGIFRIHRSFKFCPLIVERDGRTDAIRAAFMRRDLEDWEQSEPPTMPVTREQVERFSPETLSLLEFGSRRELEICDRLYAEHPLLGHEGPDAWNVEFTTEFHMTNDSELFPP